MLDLPCKNCNDIQIFHNINGCHNYLPKKTWRNHLKNHVKLAKKSDVKVCRHCNDIKIFHNINGCNNYLPKKTWINHLKDFTILARIPNIAIVSKPDLKCFFCESRCICLKIVDLMKINHTQNKTKLVLECLFCKKQCICARILDSKKISHSSPN